MFIFGCNATFRFKNPQKTPKNSALNESDLPTDVRRAKIVRNSSASAAANNEENQLPSQKESTNLEEARP